MAAQKSPQETKVAKSRDKSESFKRLATRRTNRALQSIDGLAALGNRRSYTYDEAQATKIFSALEAALARAKKAYDPNASAAQTGFSL